MRIQPLLTIGIPTYNRLPWLKECVTRIINQIAGIEPGRIELVISDNHGNDGTWDYLIDLKDKYSFIKIYRNETNIGAERNFYLIPSLASGKYIWLLGDDDYIAPGRLKEILATLGMDYDCLALNYAPSDQDHKASGNPYWNIRRNVEVSSIDECCKIVPHFAFGFISAWIMKRTLINNLSIDKYTYFSQWGLSLMADRYFTVIKSQKIFVFSDIILNTRKPPPEEYPETFDYFGWFLGGSAHVLDFLETEANLGKHITDKQKSWLLNKIAFRRIIAERSTGKLNRTRTHNILRNHYRSYWPYWALCLPALYFPFLGPAVRILRTN